MKHILKQFAEWVTSFKQSEFERASLKLALWHTLGIFAVLAISSILVIAIYAISDSGHAPEPPHSELSVYELQEHLAEVVIMVDVVVLVLVLFFSYFDARRTLRPIEVLYRTQERFMADVAHELRTPLTVMKAGTESLLRQTRTPEEYVSYLTDAHEEINRMTSLVNDLLALLRYKKIDTLTLEGMDLAAVVEVQAKNFAGYADKQGVTIEVKASPTIIKGDSQSVHRLVQNLLKNAIDYNRPEGKVVVTAELVGKQVQLRVSDTGIGISDANKAHLFDRFYRVDAARVVDKQTGAGLGLSIVKAIVEAHHATIEVVSEVDKGTTVTVSFPV